MNKLKVSGNLFDFVINFNEDEVLVEAKRWSNISFRARFIILFCEYFPSALSLVATVISAIKFSIINPYSVLFLVCAISLTIAATKFLYTKITEAKRYEFIINKTGIKLATNIFDTFISWEDVSSYGIVKGIVALNRVSGHGKGGRHYYDCIYFSKKELEEKKLKKALESFANYNLKCKVLEKSDIIVLAFSEREDTMEIYREFCKYIERFCNNKK